MRIIRYLGQCKVAALLIVCLLVAQAFCDLSLPRYTSAIVDVGIQQSGIEHASPGELSARTFDAMSALASPADTATLDGAYALTDAGTYVLTEQGATEREALDEVVAPLLVAVRFPELEPSEELASQQGIAAARAEYEALGYDLAGMQMRYLLACGAKMLGFTALGAVAAALVGLLASRSAARIARDLRGRLFERVVSLSDAEVQRFSPASLITRGTNDIQQIQMTIVLLLRMVLYAPIMAVGGVIMVATTDVSMSWVVALAVVLLLIVVGILMATTMPRFRMMQRLVDRVNLVAREMLTGLPVIRAFGRQQVESERFDDANRALMDTQLFTNRAMSLMTPAMTLIMNGVSVLIVWVGGHAIDAGTMQTGDMIAFLTYAMVIIMGFLMIGMVSVMLPRANVAAGRVDEVLAARSGIEDPARPRDTELAHTPGARISFEDVTFRYPEQDAEHAGAHDAAEAALSHVSFTAEPGTTLAIIGPTGCGKSTACKLIERFYDASEGRVTIDGIDVRELSQHALRAQIGYVPQAAFLFSGTIKDNVAFAEPEMDEGRVHEALEVAQAADFVAARDEGLDAPISQGGTNVSGGQRQRLAIARAVASDARVLLFDDSFSALDYKTDAALRRALAERLAGRTLVIVAQRIATVLDADQIVVLDDGAVVGLGTHAELMRTCEAYREIARSQLSDDELQAWAEKGGEAA